MQPPQPPRKLNLELPPNHSPTYANTVVISQTHSEIILDFVQIMPNDPRARILSRIIMTLPNAKLLLKALGVNLDRYEELHGEIQLPPTPPTLADQLFGGMKPEEKDETPNE
jgi:hypothetical protein